MSFFELWSKALQTTSLSNLYCSGIARLCAPLPGAYGVLQILLIHNVHVIILRESDLYISFEAI